MLSSKNTNAFIKCWHHNVVMVVPPDPFDEWGRGGDFFNIIISHFMFHQGNSEDHKQNTKGLLPLFLFGKSESLQMNYYTNTLLIT